jgi:hypothetical protein
MTRIEEAEEEGRLDFIKNAVYNGKHGKNQAR